MGRRFILVGLFVVGPAKRGSVMQLVLATMFALIYLVFQAQAQPYKKLADDFLAILASFLLTAFLFACLVLKYDALTQLEDIRVN